MLISVITINDLKAFTTLFKSFSKKLAPFINDILAQIWNCLVESSSLYVQKIVNSNSNDLIDDGKNFLFSLDIITVNLKITII